MKQRVYIYDGKPSTLVCAVADMVCSSGFSIVAELSSADLALAPALRTRLTPSQLSAVSLGTLVMHASMLPRHRGLTPLHWAIADGDPATGVTWFWAEHRLDTGAICDQEPVPIDDGDSPMSLYRLKIIPAGMRALRRILAKVAAGEPLGRVQQDAIVASYDPPWRGTSPVRCVLVGTV